MQFSLGRNRDSGAKVSANNTSASDSRSAAMQKAIERNRAKMNRSRPADAQSTPAPTSSMRRGRPQSSDAPPSQATATQPSRSSVLEKLRAQRDAKAAARESAPAQAAPVRRASTLRKAPTQSENIEMAAPLRRKAAPPAAVNYAQQTPARSLTKPRASVSAKRKVNAKSKKKVELTHWGVKLCWGFCLFLLGRLVFSQGGVIEYIDKKNVLDQAYHEVKMLNIENDELMKEIDLIKTNHKYKKKLVRDHLGYIARDEYLVLFPETSKKAQRGVSSI